VHQTVWPGPWLRRIAISGARWPALKTPVSAGDQAARRPTDAPSVPPLDFPTIGEWPSRTGQFERYRDRRRPSLKKSREPHQLLKSQLLNVWTYEAPRLAIFRRSLPSRGRTPTPLPFPAAMNSTPACSPAEYRYAGYPAVPETGIRSRARRAGQRTGQPGILAAVLQIDHTP
jgi:hypothetical protein